MPNDDYILRSDALKAIQECFDNELEFSYDNAQSCVYRIKRIPAADVEPKRKPGRWKIAGAFDDFNQCPECGNMWPIFSTIEWKYCPVCGAKMLSEPPKEEDDGTV